MFKANQWVGEDVPVTVCVAAICENDTIFGAADNMITAGDIQFEPPDIKIANLNNSIAVMTAGDQTVHAEILLAVRAEVNDRIEHFPDEWLTVKEVAELYSQHFNKVKERCAERTFLSPFGLTMKTFLTQQGNMAPDFVKQLGTEIINFNVGDIEAIIAGIDESGPHLWVVKNEDMRCYDKTGFAAVGAGEWHSKSSFMFARHTRYKELPQTLLLTYAAKKRGEVAPGVGSETDMFIIGPRLGTFTWIHDDILRRLETMYQAIRSEEQQILQRANAEVEKYVEEITRATTTKEQAALPEDGGGDTPADQRQLRDGTEEGQPEDEGEAEGDAPAS